VKNHEGSFLQNSILGGSGFICSRGCCIRLVENRAMAVGG